MKYLAWSWFIVVQLIMLFFTVLGWFLLIPFCLAKAWKLFHTINTNRTIDMWTWDPLNLIYGNPEDGVSGTFARTWINGTTQEPYMPNAPDWWRAYCWSALRNSCDQLKYRFAWSNGPLITFTLFERTARIGWQEENGVRVPVFSL